MAKTVVKRGRQMLKQPTSTQVDLFSNDLPQLTFSRLPMTPSSNLMGLSPEIRQQVFKTLYSVALHLKREMRILPDVPPAVIDYYSYRAKVNDE